MADYDPATSRSYQLEEEDGDSGEEQYTQADANADADGEEEDEDYDPSSFTFDQAAVEATSIKLAQPESLPLSKPKTIGGFLVDDDDDEDVEEEKELGLAVPPAGGLSSAHSAVAGEAGPLAAAQHVSLASEPQDTAAVLSAHSLRPNGSTPVVPVSDSAVAPISPLPTPAPALTVQSAAPPASEEGKQNAQLPTAASALPSATATPQPPSSTSATLPPSQASQPAPATTASQRLPHDKVGQLEDRIKEDPKGDADAWRSLITHYREKGQLDNARQVYSRFFDVFPSAASMWVEYARLELEHDHLQNVEQIFTSCLLQLPNVDMWNLYMDYLRRIHPLHPDPDGKTRGIISSAFEFLLNNVGIDPDSGRLWRDYVDFVKSGPGVVGGSGWQDAQKMDLVRKAYQKAVKLPHSELTKLWKEYDNFELSLNKATGRKYLQEHSPSYMAARSARNQLEQKIDGLDRNALPVLPPFYGCVGDVDFTAQVGKWRAWIAWEKEDPISYKDEDDVASFKKRVLYTYRQATMQLRFYPEIWYDAATWCLEQGTEDMITEGEAFLQKGIEANPESVLLALTKADRVESGLESGNSDEIAIRNGEKIDPVFAGVHKPLYALHKKTAERLERELTKIKERYANMPPEEDDDLAPDADEDRRSSASSTTKPQTRAEKMKEELDLYRSRMGEHLDQIKKTISYAWVAKMRAFRRVQGQGQPGKAKKGLRGVFAEARPQGQLTSAVYIASAQMEWSCYRDPAAAKIFERGYKLFPLDEVFTLEYIKHLFHNNDAVNASATYNTFISKIKNSDKFSLDEKRGKCRPILEYMHEYESNYGDLNQIHKVEKEMADLYPDEPEVARFGARNALPSFNALRVQLILSPTQILPAAPGALPAAHHHHHHQSHTSIERPHSPLDSSNIRLGPNGPYVASPKRALDDSDSEAPSRKFMRGDSPLKGAAGRRIMTQAAAQNSSGSGFTAKTYVPSSSASATAPPAWPTEVHRILAALPGAVHYNAYGATTFDPFKIVEFLRTVDLSRARV